LVALARPQDSTLVQFKIKDQFNREYTEKDFAGKIIFLIGSDKEGNKFNHAWGKAVGDSIRNQPGRQHVQFLRVADLRGVPFFLKGMIKGKFPKEEKKWVLLDWKGHFPKTYGFVKGACNILIFDRRGALVHKTAEREFDDQSLKTILQNLRLLMQAAAASAAN
jgi:hypothetical protein